MTFIPAPAGKHQCATPGGRLPRDGQSYYTAGTLWQCPDCARWWYAADGPTITGRVIWAPYSEFYPVRWWHRRLRKRIAENLLTPPRKAR